LALTSNRRIPVLKNWAMKTPLVIEESCLLQVSWPTQCTKRMMTVFRIKLTTTMISATLLPSAFDQRASEK